MLNSMRQQNLHTIMLLNQIQGVTLAILSVLFLIHMNRFDKKYRTACSACF